MHGTKRLINVGAVLVGMLIVQATVWGPEIAHYYIAPSKITPQELDAVLEPRESGTDFQLDTVNFMLVGDLNDTETIAFADQILGGDLIFPNFPVEKVKWPFDESHLSLGSASFQLKVAGLAWVEIVLNAWSLTGQQGYLDFARENVARFMEYEKRQLLPTGYLWNDHAVANRALIYARLWKALIKSGTPVAREEAVPYLESVIRTGRVLAKASHYTFRTNHGVMQNAALLVLATAFPGLEESNEYSRVGFERLARQLEFYLSREGVILEHSAGYQEFGVVLLRSCLDMLREQAIPIPPAWEDRVIKAENWLYMLSRPDYSVPNFGDSHLSLSRAGQAIVDRVRERDNLDQDRNEESLGDRSFRVDAGYAVFRNRLKSGGDSGAHATAVWSDFVSAAHKHADELSLIYWANGVNWWANSGYWPYGAAYRDEAIGWAGSNAPHFLGETFNSKRTSRLTGEGGHNGHQIWVLNRQNDDGYEVTRQIIMVEDLWVLVIDDLRDGQARPTELIWNTAPNVEVIPRAGGSLLLFNSELPQLLGFGTDSRHQVELEVVNGSVDPFGGWVAGGNRIQNTNAIRLVSPTDNTILAAFGKLSSADGHIGVRLDDWESRDKWSATLDADGYTYSVQRNGSRLEILEEDSSVIHISIRRSIPVASLLEEKMAYEMELATAVIYRDYLPWRQKVSGLAALLYIGSLILLILTPSQLQASRPRYVVPTLVLGSIFLSLYLHFAYFSV